MLLSQVSWSFSFHGRSPLIFWRVRSTHHDCFCSKPLMIVTEAAKLFASHRASVLPVIVRLCSAPNTGYALVPIWITFPVFRSVSFMVCDLGAVLPNGDKDDFKPIFIV